MALTPKSVKVGINLDVENPACDRTELEPLLDEAFNKAKSRLFSDIAVKGQRNGSCQPHDRVQFDKSTCP
jgi:hypothetical protein